MEKRMAKSDPREKRLRRQVQRHGFALRKNRSRDATHPGYGGFMVIDTERNAAVAGHLPFSYSFDLDQVESWLGRQAGANRMSWSWEMTMRA
jgi:hypothetical protein